MTSTNEPLAPPHDLNTARFNPLVPLVLGLQLPSVLHLAITILALAHHVLALALSLGYQYTPSFFTAPHFCNPLS